MLNVNSKLAKLSALILMITSLSAFAAAKSEPVLGASFSMAGQQLATKNSRPAAVLGTNVEYTPYKSYALGVDLSYARALHQFEYQAAKGIEDTVIYLMDKEFWKNPVDNWNLSVKLAWIFPTSEASKYATMQGGAIQMFNLKKGFGGRFSVTYGMSFTEYFYEYGIFEEDGEPVYNTKVRVVNRLTMSYDLTRSLHWSLGGSARSYFDFADDGPYEIFGMMTSLSYDVNKQASIDFAISSAAKDGSGLTPWAGPAAADYMFGARGVVIMFGTSIKI